MGFFKKKENRGTERQVEMEEALINAFFNDIVVNKKIALQVPVISGGVDLIGNIIASTPIKLYRDSGNGKAVEVKENDDIRVKLLNDETGDTLNANEFWKALTRDYFLGKGGYAYIHKEKGKIKSLHYVDEESVAVLKNSDPIFKDFDLLVGGKSYKPYQFIKVLRNTKDGAQGTPITVENSKLIELAFETLRFEVNMVKRGGNKKGFLKSEKRLDEISLQNLKAAYAKLYSNLSDNMVVLNSGVDFKESSNNAMEMQLNENKAANANEFATIFHVSPEALAGKPGDKDTASLVKLAAIPFMVAIQCALNKDFLLEKEKGTLYWAFDTKELLKGDMKERFEAYKAALESNFMQIDEVRYAENLEPLGLTWIRLGLQDVLYDPKTKEVYTPNTNQKTGLT